MTTYIINEEEKALLDAAKTVCKLWGHIRGELITSRNDQKEAEVAIVTQIECGAAVVDGQYVRDITNINEG